MPNYDYRCPRDHVWNRFCSIREHDAITDPPCEGPGEEVGARCGLPSHQVFTSMPSINNTEVMILDYPGSKRLKAGYVHAYVDPGVKKVSVGYGGALNPTTAPRHPAAKMVQPEWKPRDR